MAEAPWGERLRQIRWTLRRWSPRHMVYRLRLPIRRRRWSRDRETLCRPFRKSDAARRTSGPALVFGEFSGAHGLGRAAAYDVELLRGRHDEIVQVDIGRYLAGAAPKPLRLGRSFANVYFFCQPDTYGTVCRLIDPRDIADAWRVGRWVWETPLFPDAWRFAEHLVHEVWTPSEFCARTFRADLKIPVHVVPHAVTPPRHDTGIDMRARLGVARDAFMGLAIMDIRSCPERKNPWAHVRAWKAAFGDDPACVLVMKLRVGRHTAMVASELRELVGASSNVLITAQDLSSDEIAALHHAADVFVSLHRAEGFGLNILESLLIEKDVVATHWSANAEYGPDFVCYRPVPVRLVPKRDWSGHYSYQNFAWSDPDLSTAAAHLRMVRQARRHPPKLGRRNVA